MMTSHKDAAAAKQQLQGKKVCGKPIRIRPKFSKKQSQKYYDTVIMPVIEARNKAHEEEARRGSGTLLP